MADLPPTQQAEQPDQAPGTASAAQADEAGGKPTGHTRISGAWIGVIVAALVLTLLLVFILQNTRSVKISFFTVSGTMPIGVGMLLAAIGGVLLAAIVGSLRIFQLRHRLTGATRDGGRRRGRKRQAADVAQPGPA